MDDDIQSLLTLIRKSQGKRAYQFLHLPTENWHAFGQAWWCD
jgi:hypothetical protein